MIEEEYSDEINPSETSGERSRVFFWIPLLLTLSAFASLIVVGLAFFLNSPSATFSPNTSVTIETGESVKQITAKLENESIVHSGSFLYFIIVFLFEPKNIKASTYVFEEPMTSYQVARQLTVGDFDNDLLRFTHFEGERTTAIAERAALLLPNFNPTEFIEIAEPQEGKLFPDTYFVPETYTATELFSLMFDTYTKEVRPLQPQIAEHPLTETEILVLASLIEREANSPESMAMVSGILQNRLKINMPLQADASIEYILDKPLDELTPEDLKIDSPYNTYLNPGLPPTPIGNPGMTAIKAVLEPTASANFYYITDSEGVFHYSETYDQHLRNVQLYLR